MRCEICGKTNLELDPEADYVLIYTKTVCLDCANAHGIQCEFCGEWGLKGDEDFPSNEYGQSKIHRRCMDYQAAFNKRKR